MKKYLKLCLIITVLCFMAVSAGLGSDKGDKDQLTFAYVMPMAQLWYAYLGDAFEFAAEKYDVKTKVAISDYNQNKEIAAIEDFIIQEPDMIGLGSVSADAAQLAAQKANDAGIPLVIENSSLAKGRGKVVADLEFDWYGLGTMMADVTADNWPGSKVFVVTGVIGTGPIDMLLETFKTQAKKRGLTIVGIQNGEYQQEVAYNITQDLIQSGRDFDVIWGNNNSMGQGIIQAVKEAGLLDEKVILTGNGAPECLASVANGELEGTINYSPGFHGLLYFLAMFNYITEGDVPELIYLPMKYITKANLDEAMPWDSANDKALSAAEEYFHTKIIKY
ncbi:MAG TPA: sugar ABC transporter substrate-binding protein [Spirochaetes bacterium]|nr:sugar ABC transporter substrate-binding protein [Spirochaetota bacterium]